MLSSIKKYMPDKKEWITGKHKKQSRLEIMR
jgi:hypothetical protein